MFGLDTHTGMCPSVMLCVVCFVCVHVRANLAKSYRVVNYMGSSDR